jgi:uncharacterized protein YyaL (SSP411 family)
VLGRDAPAARQHWGVTREGSFEGHNILFVAEPAVAAPGSRPDESPVNGGIERARRALYEARAKRVWPACDDKMLASWNALMIRAMAEAARVFEREDYREAAIAGGSFLLERLVRDGRVMRSYKDATSKAPGFLEDHSAVGLAFLELFSLTFDRSWFTHGSRLASVVVEWFFDPSSGLFYDTSRDHEQLITRPRDITDNAIPSGSSLAAELLWRVAELGGNEEFRKHAATIVGQAAEMMARHPNGFGHLLGVADAIVHGASEVAIVGEIGDAHLTELVRSVSAHYLPSLVLAGGLPLDAEEPLALLRGRTAVGGRAVAYVCRRYVCDAPTSDPVVLHQQLDRASRAERVE